MRTRFALVVISLFAVFAALGSFVPAATHAAPASRPSQQNTITGTLVATPQSTLPATLLLQVGSQTIPVSISANTHIVDRNGDTLSLTALNDGDTLQVTGDPNVAGGIDATVIEDVTTPVAPPTYNVTVTGTLASEQTGMLCLSNAHVVASGITSNVTTVSPCPNGQLPLYLTSTTQILGPGGQAYTLGQLQVGDSLQATGTSANAKITAIMLQDLTTHTAPPPTYTLTISGTLAGAQPGLLCLAGARVTSSNGIAPHITVTSPCPNGQNPVYYTGSTRFIGPNNQGYDLGDLRIGDHMYATGTTANARFTASAIKDYTTHAAPIPAPPPPAFQVTIQGVLTNTPGNLSAPATLCLRDAHLVGNILGVRVSASSACPANEVPVYVTTSTRIEQRYNRVAGLYALRAGDTLRVAGTIANEQFTATQIKDYTINRSYSTLVGTVLYINPAANGAYFTMRVRGVTGMPPGWVHAGGGYGVVTVDVQYDTQFIINGTVTNQVTVLNPGQVVSVLGVYDSQSHHCTDTYRVRVH